MVMTAPWNTSKPADSPPAGDRPGRWISRPRRSSGDRKFAGVAGGLGRAFGIDPVLVRVAFVVLAIFGGIGGLLYVLGWLLLPADGDEVSALEALLGRGRSSVSPLLTGILLVVSIASVLPTFSWGLPFLPLAIGGGVAVLIGRRRRGHDWRSPHYRRQQWEIRDEWMRHTDDQVSRMTEHALRWAAQRARPPRWSGSPTGGSPAPGAAPQPVNLIKDGTAPFNRTSSVPPTSADASDESNATAADRAGDPAQTPPAWDPLGAAPFAWDLPEPTPLSDVATPSGRRSGVATRVTLGAALLAGGLAAAGVFAGWWALTWAQVSGLALAVLAAGLLLASLRGRGRSLIAPGIFLSLVTAALAISGISGTAGYGAMTVAPTFADLQPAYRSNAGSLIVDLSALAIPPGTTRTLTVKINGGRAEVIVPPGVAVQATCTTGAGRAQCLGNVADGVQKSIVADTPGVGSATDPTGTLVVAVTANAGVAEVRTT